MSNVRRTFDGGSGILRLQDWTITPFWAELVIVRQYEFDESDPGKQLFGIYATGPVPLLPVRADLLARGQRGDLQPALSAGTPLSREHGLRRPAERHQPQLRDQRQPAPGPVIALAIVMVFGFTALGWIGSRIDQERPPISAARVGGKP